MASIIGQAMQGAGPSLGALGSYIGSAFSPTAAAAGPSDAALAAANTTASTPIDLSTTPSSSGLLSSGPTDTAFGSLSAPPVPSLLTGPSAGAPPSLLGSAASGMPVLAGGGGGGADPFSNISNPAADASGNITAPTPGGQPSLISRIITAITGKDPSKGGTGAFIGDIGNLGEAIQRWQAQRTLQNPSDVLKQSQILSGGLSKALKRNIGAATGQEMANAGLAGAPGLYSQAVASALAPYRYEQQQAALKDYLAAMQESMGAYPGTGGLYGPYGGYGQYPGEQQQTAQASP